MDEDDEDDEADVEASDPSARPSFGTSFGGWVLSLASPLDDAHDAEDDAYVRPQTFSNPFASREHALRSIGRDAITLPGPHRAPVL